MFQSLMDKMASAFQSFKNKGKLTPADVKVGMRQIKLALLEADVNFKVVKEFVNRVHFFLRSVAVVDKRHRRCVRGNIRTMECIRNVDIPHVYGNRHGVAIFAHRYGNRTRVRTRHRFVFRFHREPNALIVARFNRIFAVFYRLIHRHERFGVFP